MTKILEAHETHANRTQVATWFDHKHATGEEAKNARYFFHLHQQHDGLVLTNFTKIQRDSN